ncbi:MAG: DedA family protein [Rhodoplanes sp.]|uniref:DedA family protein n=1 Tax=Rhodoplanes sp. TaxID=1968906 RepID=UPI001839E749|nr:DedA family protein [Rhodoplanes sp.]NVO15925.1 DedA family protein [Rhodoplanes sp.]
MAAMRQGSIIGRAPDEATLLCCPRGTVRYLEMNRVRLLATCMLILALVATALFGYRTYRSFQLLRSAYDVGAPRTSGIRGWMTLKYVSTAYRVSEASLGKGLQLPPDVDTGRSLKSLAEEARISPPQYVQRVQRVIAEHMPVGEADHETGSSTWFGAISEGILTWLLISGYAALGFTILLGAVGVPLPTGIAMALAGSLAAQGRMDLMWAGAIAVVASVAGDVVGYGLGRMLSLEFLERRGRWIGYTPGRHAHVHELFDRWGLVTVFITRTFVSYLSSIANLFAGVIRFRLVAFLMVAVLGRVAWAAAYMGLGWLVGSDLDAAAGFLTNLSLLFLALVVVAGSAVLAFRRTTVAAG